MNALSPQPVRVLVVDDDDIASEMLARQIRSLGYEVDVADDGLSAWDLWQTGRHAIVISDWLMPGITGVELVDRVRAAAQADTRYSYCILLTVKGKPSDLVEAMEAGADDFLTKPFNPGELRVRLNAGVRIIELERKLTAANQRMKRELQNASKIQHGLLPSRTPQFPSHRFAWRYTPCDELGGDILNIIPLDEDHVAFYLLDVAGHGVCAALVSVALSRVLTTAANSSTIIREQDESGAYHIGSPAEVLARLNDQFCTQLDEGRFFTMMYGVLNVRSGELRYAAGGHPPAILVSADGQTQALESTGTLVGIFEDATYDEQQLSLSSGDRLFVYSDGITEAQNEESVEFGSERLTSFVAGACAEPNTGMDELLDSLVETLVAWTQSCGFDDDVSCLMLEAQ